MSFFNFYRNYRKARELDQLKSSINSAEQYLSYRTIKWTGASHCPILKMYAENAMMAEESRRLFLKQKEIIDKNYELQLKNMVLTREKLQAEIELLKQKLKQNGKRD